MYPVLLSIVINSLILKYVLENERNNCECALTWHHNFIKFFTPVIIFMLFVELLFNDVLNKNKNQVVSLLRMALNVVSVFYTIIIVVYFFKLKFDECKCSEDWKRNILAYPLFIFVIIIILSLLSMLIVKRVAPPLIGKAKKIRIK